MPLPLNTPLSLQGPSDAVQTKTKQAIFVRLTAEALDALEAAATSGSSSKLQVEFGDKPGIFINGKCFPVQAQQENIAHELYVRTITGNKPSNALKLSAAVTGRFTVQPRGNDTSRDDGARPAELEISSRLKVMRREEEEKREKNKIQMLDFPPDLKPLGGLKKKRTPVTNAATSHARNKPSLDATTVPSTSRTKPSSPLPPPTASGATPPVVKDNPEVRRRLIRFLAYNPASSTDDVLGRVGGKAASAEITASILSMLPEVAESSSQGKNSAWTLKPRTWLDVRPYEWSNLTDRDRERLAAEATTMLNKLRVPRSDPAWAHLRDPNAAQPSSTPGTGSPAAQVPGQRPHGLPAKPDVTNGATSGVPRVGAAGGSTTAATVKAKVAVKSSTTSSAIKTKVRDVPITAKDEGARVARSEGVSKKVRKLGDSARADRYDDTSETDGSNSRARRLHSPDKEVRKAGSPLPPARIPPSGSASSQDRDRPRAKHERTESLSKPRRDGMDVDMDDRRKAPPPPRPVQTQLSTSQERLRAPPMKRKSSEEGEVEDSEPGEVVVPSKRRRVDEAVDSSSMRSARMEREAREGRSKLAPPSGATSATRRLSPSVQPAPKAPSAKHSREMSTSTTTSSIRGERDGRHAAPAPTTSAKRRRENIDYTSSSDDDGDAPLRQTVKKVKPRPTAEPARGTSPPRTTRGISPIRTKVKVKTDSMPVPVKRAASPPPPRSKVKTEESDRGRSPLPTFQRNGKVKPEDKLSKPPSRGALRAKYTKLHSRYLITYGRVAQHKARAQRLLEGGSDSDDEDSDADFLDTEELGKLMGEMKKVARELDRVRKEYEEMNE